MTESGVVLQAPPRPLVPAGWVSAAEAIAWVGFASAVPQRRWDEELVLGLTLWPWVPPSMVRHHLYQLAWYARLGAPPYTKQPTPGHLSYLNGALRSLADRNPRAVWPDPAPPTSELQAGSDDLSVQAEAAHQLAMWDDTLKARVSAAFLRATLATDALRAALAGGGLVAFGVPATRENARSGLVQRELIPPSLFAAPATLTPDGLYPFVPNDFERGSTQGPAFLEVLLPANELARLFPYKPGEPPDLPAAAFARPTLRDEAAAMEAQQDDNPERIARTGSPGRPTVSKELYVDEHRRRLALGKAHPNLTKEATDLLEWLQTERPRAARPTLKTVMNSIRAEHRRHLHQPRLKRAPEDVVE